MIINQIIEIETEIGINIYNITLTVVTIHVACLPAGIVTTENQNFTHQSCCDSLLVLHVINFDG
jgi:hypothetical protein